MTRRGLFRLFRGAAAVPVAAVIAPHLTYRSGSELIARWVWEPGMMCGNWRAVVRSGYVVNLGGPDELHRILLKQRFGEEITHTIVNQIADCRRALST